MVIKDVTAEDAGDYTILLGLKQSNVLKNLTATLIVNGKFTVQTFFWFWWGVKFVKIGVKSQYNKESKIFLKIVLKTTYSPSQLFHGCLLSSISNMIFFFFNIAVGMYIRFSVGVIMTNPRVLSMCVSLTATPARMWSFAVVQEGVMRTALDLCPIFSFQ